MADETAFNLSAAISLQLATGAGAALRKQIDNIKNIEVPVTFKDVSASEQEKLIKKALKPIPIKVKFDRESVRANLTEEVLLGMMTKAQKNIVIPIKVQWDKDTAAKLQAVQKDIEKLTKYADKLKKAAGVNNVNTGVAAPITAGGKAAKAAVDDVDELIDAFKRLSKQSKDSKFGDVLKGKNFFQQAEAQIDRLAKKLKGLGASDGLSKLKEKFQGIGGDESARNNLLRSLTTLFKGLTDVKDAEEQVKAAGKNLGKSFNMTDALKGIKETRESITSLFDSMASSDPNTFSISMISSVRKMQKSIGQSINTAGKDLRAFDSLLSSLNQKKAIAKDAKNTESVKNIGKLIQEVKDQYKSGASVSDIKSSARFQELNALLGNLKYIEQGAKRAEIAMDNLTRKASKELKASKGGQLLGLDATATFIGRQAGRDIRKTSDPAEIAKIVDIAKNAYNEVAQRADKVNRQFDRLESQIIKFEESDFTNAANSLKGYRIELEKLILAGTSIQNIDNSVTRELAKAANLQGLDAKVNTGIKQINRLRNALNFSPVDDVAGAKPALDQLEDNLKKRQGAFAGLTGDKLDAGVSKGLFDIRGMQRFNEASDTTINKLHNISDGFEDLSKVDVYQKYISQFEAGSRKIAASSDSVGKKLQQLKKLSDNTLTNAKLDSEGGFFGSIARSAGLATKRLAAFLVLAQGLYGIQGVLSSSIGEAVKVDKEFTRLEQVFNKDVSGTKLVQSLKFTTNQVKALSVQLGVSVLEVATAAQTLAQADIRGKDLEKLLTTISKSQLGPSFGSASETAEATIAIMKQFNLTAEGTQAALGGINRLSAKYAVEAKGITEAVRRAGGVFATSGDDISSFAAAFTLVKQKTREADESIATGLRNVAQRLQSSDTQEKLREALGIDLVENGEFIGFENAITAIGTALKGVSTQSSKFAKVREIIGGARQGGRVTPLLENFGDFEKLKSEFAKGARSIDEDVSVAFQSIENKLARAKSAVTDLFHEIISSDLSKFLVDAFSSITIFATRLLKTLNSIPGAILSIGAAAKILGASKFIGQAFLSHFAPRTPIPFIKNKGGPIGFNDGGKAGGFIPGGGPNRDSLLAYLTTGEYVLQRKAVKKYGRTFLDNLNDGTINANKGGPIGRNGGGIIPGFNTGGLSGSGGVSSLFNGFIGFIKKVIGLGDAIEKTTQEIQTGLNLPELFDRAIKPRSAPIDIDIKSLLKDKAQTNINTIRKSGPFVEGSGTSGDKFLPKPGTPELPSSIMDDIIKDALKTPAKSRIPVQPYKGNSAQLRDLSKEAGIDIPKKLFTQLFKGVNIVGSNKDVPVGNGGASGSFNKRSKTATFTEASVFNPKLVAHEIGHGLEVVVTGKLKGIAAALQKGGVGDRTRQRMIKSGIYGKEGSAKFEQKFNSESLADIFKEAAALKSGDKTNASEYDKKFLNLFTNVLKKQTGISITGRSKNSDAAIGLSGSFDNRKQTDAERALGAGVRLPGSFNKPLNPVSQSIIDNRNNAEIRGSSSSGNFQSIIEAIRKQGAFKGEPKSLIPFNNTPTSGGNPLGGSGKSYTGGISDLGKLLPTGSLVGFGKSLVTSRGGLIGLASAAFLLQGALGGVSNGFTDLISAMGVAALSLYTMSKVANIRNFAQTAASGGIDKLKSLKAKSIGESFKEAAKAKKASIYGPSLPITKLDAFSADGFKSAERGKLAINSRSSKNSSSVIANIRAGGAAAGPIGTPKSAGALSNIAASKDLGKLGKTLGGFAGSVGSLANSFSYLAIATGLVVGAMNFFVGSLEEAAISGKENAKTAEEARAAGSKGRLAEVLKKPVKAAGAAATGAVTGAALGSLVAPLLGPFGPLAPLIGGIAGGLIGLISVFKKDLFNIFNDTFPLLGSMAEALKEGLDNWFKRLSDSLYVDYKNVTSKEAAPEDKLRSTGSLIGKAKGLSGFGALGLGIGALATGAEFATNTVADIKYGKKDRAGKEKSVGQKRLKLEEQKDTLDFNVSKIGKDFTNTKYGRNQRKLNQNEVSNLKTKAVFATGLLEKEKDQSRKGGRGGGFRTFSQEAQDQIKGEIQSIADVYKSSGPENRKIIIDQYKSMNIDIMEVAKEVEVSLDTAQEDMSAAFDKLSVFFTKMKNVSALSGARISGVEGALSTFNDPSKQSTDLPDQYFDILRQGIDPNKLGLGNTFKQGEDRLGSLAQSFDPRLLKNAQFEVDGRRAARATSTAIIDAAPRLKNTKNGDITGFLKGRFSDANGGNQQLNDAFEGFVNSKGDAASSELVNKDGDINANKVNDLFQEFADSLDNGALAEMQRLNNLSKQYVDQYKGHMAARFALENEATALLQSNVDKRRSIGDIENKSKGLTGDKLAKARGKQAATADTQRLGLTLQGTGLGGNSSVAQMQAALLASQQRGRNAAALAQAGGGTQADKDTRRAQIESGAEEEQARIKAGLTLVANGTDTATHAMEEFERASQKAAASSKFLSDALLGSDDQMHQTILGIQAMAKVQQAFKQGGVGAANQVVGTLGEDARQALGSYVGQNEDTQSAFNNMVGISSNITAGPEAAAAQGAITEQIAANNALTAGLSDNAKAMMANTETMRAMYESQFKNASAIVSQAEATSKALVDKIASLPEVIKHDMSMVVKIEGAANLAGLEPTIRKFTEELINARFNDLIKENHGLNKPSESAK